MQARSPGAADIRDPDQAEGPKAGVARSLGLDELDEHDGLSVEEIDERNLADLRSGKLTPQGTSGRRINERGDVERYTSRWGGAGRLRNPRASGPLAPVVRFIRRDHARQPGRTPRGLSGRGARSGDDDSDGEPHVAAARPRVTA